MSSVSIVCGASFRTSPIAEVLDAAASAAFSSLLLVAGDEIFQPLQGGENLSVGGYFLGNKKPLGSNLTFGHSPTKSHPL